MREENDMNREPNLNKNLQSILHPYTFVLEEGKTIEDNLLDYSLKLFRVGYSEIIQSPGSEHVMRILPTALAIKNNLNSEAQR